MRKNVSTEKQKVEKKFNRVMVPVNSSAFILNFDDFENSLQPLREILNDRGLDILPFAGRKEVGIEQLTTDKAVKIMYDCFNHFDPATQNKMLAALLTSLADDHGARVQQAEIETKEAENRRNNLYQAREEFGILLSGRVLSDVQGSPRMRGM